VTTHIQKRSVGYLDGKTLLGDKIYTDLSFFNQNNPVKIFTRHKEIKAKPTVIN